MSCQILNSRTFCQFIFELLSYPSYCISLCSSMVMVCEHHIIEMPILGVKEAMSAMSNPSLLSTFCLEKPSLTHEYEK